MNNIKSLKEKTITGFKWSFLDNVGRFGGQFVIGIILTRLLSPKDFGLVGMLAIFIVIGQSLTNSGFGQALIQKKDANKIDFSTVFYFNIFASLLIYALIFIGSPLIAKFYNEPQLISLTKVICLSFVINAFGLIHIVHLEKKLDFKTPSIIGVTSVFISGAISIFLAYKGFGVWALVTHTVIRSFITTILFWKLSNWTPLLKFSKNSLKGLFSYGSKILLAGLVQSIFQNIYYLIIGRFFQAQSLGYYTRAAQFKDLPINTMTAVVQRVTFPVFSTIQDDNKKLIVGYTKAIRLLSAAALPLMVLIFITSKPLIHIVLGSQWLPVVPYLQLMSLYGWIYVIHTINNQIITIKGHSDYFLRIKILDKVLIVISILLTYRYGITAMIYGHMAATILSFLIGSFYLNKVIEVTLLYQIKNILPFFISAVLMLTSSIPLSIEITSGIKYLISSVLLGSIIYVLILRVLKVEELNMGFNLVKKFLNRKYNNGGKQ